MWVLIMGWGLVLLERGGNGYVREVGGKERGRRGVKLWEWFNGLGGILGRVWMGELVLNDREEGGNVVVGYRIVGIVVLVIGVVLWGVDLGEMSDVGRGEDEGGGCNMRKVFWDEKMFVFGVVGLVRYEVGEI